MTAAGSRSRDAATTTSVAAYLRCVVVLLACLAIAPAEPPSNVAELKRAFENPRDDARIMMRWWWFGPAVKKPELLSTCGGLFNPPPGRLPAKPQGPILPYKLDH